MLHLPDAPWIRRAGEESEPTYPPCPCCGSESYEFIFYADRLDEYFCTECCRAMEPEEFADEYADE